jgi:hypothetical protein
MHQLQREMSRGGQIGCTLLTAMVIGGIGATILLHAYNRPPENGLWVYYVVGAGFCLFAIFLVYAFFHQILALRSPITRVSIDTPQLTRGHRVRVHFEQRGPLELESLRANLIGSQWVRRGNNRETRDLGTTTFLDSGAAVIDDVLPLRREAVLLVPEDAPPSDDSTTWKIEVWGKVRRGADFHHKFDVKVV